MLQMAEQLVEAPTIDRCFIPLVQIAHIPRLRGPFGTCDLRGLLPGQVYSWTAEQIVDNPVPRRGLSSPASSEHIPVPHDGQHDLHPPSAADFSNLRDTADHGFFRTFLRCKKRCEDPARSAVRVCPGVSVHGFHELSWGRGPSDAQMAMVSEVRLLFFLAGWCWRVLHWTQLLVRRLSGTSSRTSLRRLMDVLVVPRLCSRCSHLEIWIILLSTTLSLAVIAWASGCCGGVRIWIFRGIRVWYVRNTWFDSGYMFCTVLCVLEEFHTFPCCGRPEA